MGSVKLCLTDGAFMEMVIQISITMMNFFLQFFLTIVLKRSKILLFFYVGNLINRPNCSVIVVTVVDASFRELYIIHT